MLEQLLPLASVLPTSITIMRLEDERRFRRCRHRERRGNETAIARGAAHAGSGSPS